MTQISYISYKPRICKQIKLSKLSQVLDFAHLIPVRLIKLGYQIFLRLVDANNILPVYREMIRRN